jgi:DNA replication and repair protein RecF
VRLNRLWLADFRNYRELELGFAPGCTLVVGANGQGKTNLVEAVAFLAVLDSFRGSPLEALVRDGAGAAIVRGDIRQDERELLVEVEVPKQGRVRAQVNRQPLARARDLLGVLRVSVFSPDDLALVKDGPAERRRFLDDCVVALHPPNDQVRSDVERILRQRNALLRQSGGRLTDEIRVTLDVWDERLAAAGEQLAKMRGAVVSELAPLVTDAYASLAGIGVAARVSYEPVWRATGLREALARSRLDDLRRGVSLVGPHRDDLDLHLGGLPARTHASQGEQRTLALALRLSAHELTRRHIDATPVLVLDDVFSELDQRRSAALLDHLPAGQILMTTAGVLPERARPDVVVHIDKGTIT